MGKILPSGSRCPVRKTINRIYLSPGKIAGKKVAFSTGDRRHLEKVLRLGEGDPLRATDGEGAEYTLRLRRGGSELRAEIVEKSHPRRESPLSVTLVQALPKGDLMAQVIQKAVELGVQSIVPVTTVRTVVSARAGAHQGKMRRWRKIIEGAVAQSGRTRLPALGELQPLEAFLREAPPGDRRVLLLEGEPAGLGEVLQGRGSPASVLLAVGPEGGWEEREVADFREAGFVAAGMGPRILRTGTAGPAALGIVQFLFGDLGRGGQKGRSSEIGGEAL